MQFEWQDVYEIVPTELEKETATRRLQGLLATPAEVVKRIQLYEKLYERRVNALISRRLVSAQLAQTHSRHAKQHKDQLELLGELSRAQRASLADLIGGGEDGGDEREDEREDEDEQGVSLGFLW